MLPFVPLAVPIKSQKSLFCPFLEPRPIAWLLHQVDFRQPARDLAHEGGEIESQTQGAIRGKIGKQKLFLVGAPCIFAERMGPSNRFRTDERARW